MKPIFACSLALATALLGGCSSAPSQPPVYSESFIASVTDQGLRQFEFALQLSPQEQGDRRGPPGGGHRANPGGMGTGPGGGMGGPGGGMGGGMGGPGGGMGGSRSAPGRGEVERMRRGMDQDVEAVVYERLEQHLAESAYCSNGYFIISKDIGSLQGSLKGECRSAEEG